MMNKKEAKLQFLQKQLEDPNLSEYEKENIKFRLGIDTIFSKEDFIKKQGSELLTFVINFFHYQEKVIRRKERTKSPFQFLTNTQKTIYYLSCYDTILEDDSLEQLYDIGCFEEIEGLIEGFEKVGRTEDAKLVKSILDENKITKHKLNELLNHFQENEEVVDSIERDIEKFIRDNIDELMELQNL